jgi:hypothetical protein
MSTVASARYKPHDAPVAVSATNLDKAAVSRDSASLEKCLHHPASSTMNDNLDPQAKPFMPCGGNDDRPPWHPDYDRLTQHQAPPPMPPSGPASAQWHPTHAPPLYFTQNQYGHFAMPEQARAQHWAQSYGYPHYHGHSQPYGPPVPHQYHYPYPQPPPPPAPPLSQYQNQQMYHPAYHAAMQQTRFAKVATNAELQYVFNAVNEGLKYRYSAANNSDRATTQPPKKTKRAKAKAKAALDCEVTPEYGTLHRRVPLPDSYRINKLRRALPPIIGPKKGRHGDEKIMLPAPCPLEAYLTQASEESTTLDSPGQKNTLVVLDLNGTVLYRPTKNPKSMIARPYLTPFLRYLFQNFKVMVWSSAQPASVKSLLEQALDKELRSMLVATWARDTFGLSAKNYSQNVQVYKNLKMVWSRDQIQQFHPAYAAGERFGQHNTVLIDDSALKAHAQPHNLLEIPEFEATPEQMESDVLREVAGYLEELRRQADISKYIKREPFKSGDRWTYAWPDEASSGGDMKNKVSLEGSGPSPTLKILALARVSLAG